MRRYPQGGTQSPYITELSAWSCARVRQGQNCKTICTSDHTRLEADKKRHYDLEIEPKSERQLFGDVIKVEVTKILDNEAKGHFRL